jgi:hypothetical protein
VQIPAYPSSFGGKIMELDIHIETVDEDVLGIPLTTDANNFQVRSDGIKYNGKLYFWEEILTVHITNREAIRKLRKK